MIQLSLEGNLSESYQILQNISNMGYSAADISQVIYLIVKKEELEEETRLLILKEIGLLNLNISEGVDSILQIGGFLSKMYNSNFK